MKMEGIHFDLSVLFFQGNFISLDYTNRRTGDVIFRAANYLSILMLGTAMVSILLKLASHIIPTFKHEGSQLYSMIIMMTLTIMIIHMIVLIIYAWLPRFRFQQVKAKNF